MQPLWLLLYSPGFLDGKAPSKSPPIGETLKQTKMLSTKNFSSQQVALFTALPIASVIAFTAFVSELAWGYIVVLFLGFFIFSYLLVYFTVQRFIYRKIKIIYKLIYQTKASKREEFYYKSILPQKSILEVKDDVEKWAKTYSAEMEVLKKNEAYRKEFLLNLSHELKTPIFAIQGYVDTLLNGALYKPEVNKNFL